MMNGRMNGLMDGWINEWTIGRVSTFTPLDDGGVNFAGGVKEALAGVKFPFESLMRILSVTCPWPLTWLML